jgi:hypothetical protein
MNRGPGRATAFKNKTWASFFQKPAVYIEDQEDDKFAMMMQVVSPFLKIFALLRRLEK